MTNLFAYGELRCATRLRELLGRLPMAEPALVRDHARRPDPETGYFIVRPAPGARVAGLLLRGLDDEALARIDEYEGAAYQRVRTEVIPAVCPADKVPAWIYLASEREQDR